MLSVKLIVIMMIAISLFTAGITQLRPALAISNNKDVIKPKTGDRVDVWGAWVTDKPKGWHEIHPAWKVAKVK